MPWLGPLLVVPILAWHLYHSNAWRKECMLIVTLTIAGSLFDQILLSSGWIQYPAGTWPSGLLPLWMLALWAAFSTTLNVSLRWMHGKPLLAALFGLIGGPLAYLAGQKLGAMELLAQTNMLLALGVGWGLMMPVMLALSNIWDGYKPLNSQHLQSTGAQHV